MEALEMERPMTAWNDDRLDELNERVKLCATKEGMNSRFDVVDQRLDGIDKRFEEVDKRFDGIDKRFDGIDKRLDGIDKRFEAFEGQLNRVLNTLLAAALGFGGTLLVAVLGLIASQV
jgi:archaellum component FlaC